MPGINAAAQSSRFGNKPNEPDGVSATMRNTPVFSANTLNGRRILRFMSVNSLLNFGFIDLPDHVERTLRVVFEFITQDSFTSVQRIFTADQLALHAGELLGRKKWLRE